MRLVKIFFTCFSLSPFHAFSATFIGNGGNASDLELAITLNQIKDVMDEIPNTETQDLCVCKEDDRDTYYCSLLKNLSQDQITFCQKTLAQFNSQIGKNSDFKSKEIKFKWTQQKIKLENNRVVDAVTNADKNSITLQQNIFLKLTKYQRMALLTHELFHLISFDGKYPRDEESIGPFNNVVTFFDTLGASVIVLAARMDLFYDYEDLYNISHGYKQHWFSLNLFRYHRNESENKKLLHNANENNSGFNASYRQFIYENFGGNFEIESMGLESFKTTSKNAIYIEEKSSLYGLGLAYRYFPFDDPLTRWGQFHLTSSANLYYGTHRLKFDDSYVNFEDHATSHGYKFNLEAMFPIILDFWGVFGMGVSEHFYQFKKLDIKIQKPITHFNLGGSYGF